MHVLPPIFGSLALLAILGIVVTLLLRRLRLPPVAGLLVAGALAGPFGFGLLSDLHHIEVLAEVGYLGVRRAIHIGRQLLSALEASHNVLRQL